jgi:hypothetical protein
MPDSARRVSAPLIAAVVAGVLAVALAIVLFAVVLPDDDTDGSGASTSRTTGGLTVRERTAMNAAATEAVNLQSFRLARFESDWQRAVNGATGGLRSDLAALKAKTKTTLTKNKEDLRAEVQDTAMVGPTESGKGYVVLVTINGYQVIGGKTGDPVPQRLSMTMIEKAGKWLASDVSQRGTS